MLTDQDIQKLKKVVATKEDLKEVHAEISGLRSNTEKGFEEVHAEISDLKTLVQSLAVSVDGLAKSVDDLRIEYAAVLGKLDRHERWIKQIADKIGVHLDEW